MVIHLNPIMLGLLAAGLCLLPHVAVAEQYEQILIADPEGATQLTLAQGDSVTHAVPDGVAIDVSVAGNVLHAAGIAVTGGSSGARDQGGAVKAHAGGRINLLDSSLTASSFQGNVLHANGTGSAIDGVGLSIRGSGLFANGVLAEQGAAICLEDSKIVVHHGRGLLADGASIDFNNGHISMTSGTTAVLAQHRGRISLHNVHIEALDGWRGVESVSGGEVVLEGGSISMGRSGSALDASGPQSRIRAKNVDIKSGNVMVRDGAQVVLESAQLGNGHVFLSSAASGPDTSSLTMRDTHVISRSDGLSAANGTVVMAGGSVLAEGTAADMSAYRANDKILFQVRDAALTSTSENALRMAGYGNSVVVNASNVTLTALGSAAMGVDAFSGDLTMSRFDVIAGKIGVLSRSAKVLLSGGAVKAYQDGGIGVRALYQPVWGGQSADVRATRVNIDVFGDSAVGAHACNRGSILTLDDATVTAHGRGGFGLYALGSGAELNAHNTVVHVRGDNAFAATVHSGAAMTLNASQLLASGKQSAAIVSRNTAAAAANTFLMRGGSHASTQDGVGLLASGGDHRFVFEDATVTARSFGREDVGIFLQTQGSTILEKDGPVWVDAKHVAVDASASRFVGDVVALSGNVDLSLKNQSVLTGALRVQESGRIERLMLDATSTWNVRGDSRVDTLHNAGMVRFVAPGPAEGFKTLTVNNYLGGGTLVFNTHLGDDLSPTDRLVIDGGVITGHTAVRIVNAGGNGKLTDRGIHMIETVNGAVAQPDAFYLSAASSGFRRSTGTVGLNGYEYSLAHDSSEGDQSNWFLTSIYVDPPPELEPDPTPGPQPDPGGDAGGGAPSLPIDPQQPIDVPDVPDLPEPERRPDEARPVLPGVQNVSPESGAYVGNQIAATELFAHRLRDRVVAQGDGRLHAWSRVLGRHDSGLRMAEGRVDIKRDSALVQVGSDLLRLPVGGDGAVYAGVMAGYGDARTQAVSTLRLPGQHESATARARGKLSGYSAGVYATAYANDTARLGAYADTWLQVGRYKNHLNSELGATQYRSTVWSASVEAGYAMQPFAPGGALSALIVEPQAQLRYSHYRAQEAELQGTRLRNNGKPAWQSRLGTRLYSQAEGTMRPFVEVNWLHRAGTPSVVMGDTTLRSAPIRNAMELMVGAQGGTGRVQVSAQLFGQAGTDRQRAYGGMLNMAYRW